jgi:hypothetical protein
LAPGRVAGRDELLKVLEPPAHHRPGAGGGLDEDHRGPGGPLLAQPPEGPGDLLQARRLAAAHVGAGMEDEAVEAEPLGPVPLLQHAPAGLLVERRVGAGQVHEVGGVADERLEARPAGFVAEPRDGVVRQRGRAPLGWRFHEEL